MVKKISWIQKYGQTSLSTYKLFDESGTLEVTADLNRLTDPIQLRFFDNQYYIGFLEAPSYSHRYRTFYLYDPVTHMRLISGEYNYWGTHIRLVNELTQRPFAEMSSNYFCIWCDWHFKMTDRETFKQIPINPKTLLLTLGLQAENWRTYEPDCHCDCDCDCDGFSAKRVPPPLNNKIKKSLQHIQSTYHMTPIEQPSEEAISKIITQLDDAFYQKNLNISLQTNAQKDSAYVDFCLNYIKSNQISNKDRELIFYLLNRQLKKASSDQ
jgi:hypothetical protein